MIQSILTSNDVSGRLRKYFHNWLLVQPRHGLTEMSVLGYPTRLHTCPSRLPMRGGRGTHAVTVERGDPVWVCVVTGGSNSIHGRHMDYLVVFVDHEDHALKPGYEYILPLSVFQVVESKRPL